MKDVHSNSLTTELHLQVGVALGRWEWLWADERSAGVLPGDLTLVDVQASLGHVAHAPLGLLGGEGAEVVHKRSLVRNLKVADAAVALQGERMEMERTSDGERGIGRRERET